MDLQDNKKMDIELRNKCATHLEANGWRRDIAGEDWEPALDTCVTIAKYHRVGILVTGAFGCGKTSFINAIGIRHSVNLVDREALDWLDCESEQCGLRYYTLLKGDVLLDDLGAELPRNDFGVRRELVGEFITAYHLKGEGRLFITTNLKAEEIVGRYGGRVADRLKPMCVPLAFKGASKRMWANAH